MIRVRPLDAALFKDGKPFTPGEGTRTRSFVRLPPQETLYGALRHLLLQENKVDLQSYLEGTAPEDAQKLLGAPASGRLGELEIAGPFLEIEEGPRRESLFPWPADVVRVTNTGEYAYLTPAPMNERPCANWPHQWIRSLMPIRAGIRFDPADSVELSMETPDAFLLATGPGPAARENDSLRQYLMQGGLVREIGASHVFSPEPHTGVAIAGNTRTAKDGALYTAEFLRGAAKSVRVSYTFDATPEPAFRQPRLAGMGGERRPFAFECAEAPSWRLPPFREERQNWLAAQVVDNRLQFRLILLTPALFPSSGWLPDWIDPDTGASRAALNDQVNYQLLGAAIPKPLFFSGWDLRKRGPKDSRAHIAPGAVYFFEATGAAPNLAEAVMNRFWLRSIHQPADDRAKDDRAKLGLGISIVGGMSIG